MKKTNKSKDAFVLLIAMAFISLLALGSTFLLKVSSQKAFTESRRTYSEMARIIAESGVHYSVSAIRRDFDNFAVYRDGDSVQVGEGTAVVKIEETEVLDEYDLTSTGTYKERTATVGVRLRLGSDEDSDGDEYYDGTIFCGGTLKLVGNPSIGTETDGAGSIHVGSIDCRGNPDIYGRLITSNKEIEDSSNIHATTKPFFEREEEWIAIIAKEYGTIASNNNEYVSGDYKPSGNDKKVINPVGGVLWVNGDFEIKGNCVVNGCVVAKKITSGGTVDHVPQKNFPAFISFGDITLKGNVNVDGSYLPSSAKTKLEIVKWFK